MGLNIESSESEATPCPKRLVLVDLTFRASPKGKLATDKIDAICSWSVRPSTAAFDDHVLSEADLHSLRINGLKIKVLHALAAPRMAKPVQGWKRLITNLDSGERCDVQYECFDYCVGLSCRCLVQS